MTYQKAAEIASSESRLSQWRSSKGLTSNAGQCGICTKYFSRKAIKVHIKVDRILIVTMNNIFLEMQTTKPSSYSRVFTATKQS